MPDGGLTDEELLKRLAATNSEAFVAVVAKELAEARGEGQEPWVAEIHARFAHSKFQTKCKVSPCSVECGW